MRSREVPVSRRWPEVAAVGAQALEVGAWGDGADDGESAAEVAETAFGLLHTIRCHGEAQLVVITGRQGQLPGTFPGQLLQQSR